MCGDSICTGARSTKKVGDLLTSLVWEKVWAKVVVLPLALPLGTEMVTSRFGYRMSTSGKRFLPTT